MPIQTQLFPSPNQDLIDDLLGEADVKGRKPGSVYFRLVELYQGREINLTIPDLEYLQVKLNYKPAWVKMKAIELGLDGNAKPSNTGSSKPFFEGLISVADLSTVKTKSGQLIAFITGQSLRGNIIKAVMFPDLYNKYGEFTIPGSDLICLGFWEREEDDYVLIINSIFNGEPKVF